MLEAVETEDHYWKGGVEGLYPALAPPALAPVPAAKQTAKRVRMPTFTTGPAKKKAKSRDERVSEKRIADLRAVVQTQHRGKGQQLNGESLLV